MAEQEMKLAVAGKKKHYRFGRRPNPQPESSPYTSNVVEIKDDIFDVGATSGPAKFTKSLKNIKTYIQRTYNQKMKKPTFDPPEKLDKSNAWTAQETKMLMSTIWPSSHGKKIGSW
jgi:hypothetical protein